MTKITPAIKLSRAFGFLREVEVIALQNIIESLPSNPHAVNIGAGCGTSGLCVIQRSDAFLTTIDIEEDKATGSLKGERNAFQNSGIEYKDRHEQILGDSIEIGKKWKKKVDLVFIDGNHTYEYAAGDIKTWLPHIKKNGIIVVHDYQEHFPGVRKAVNELLKPHYNEIIIADTANTMAAFEIVKEI